MTAIQVSIHRRETRERPNGSTYEAWILTHRTIIDDSYSPEMVADTIEALDKKINAGLGRV